MFRKFRKKVITGILILAPIAATLYVFAFMIKIIARLTAPLAPILLRLPFFSQWPAAATYAVSFIAALVLLWFLGATASNILGRTVLSFTERLFLKAPVINKIYAVIKQIIDTVAAKKSAFRKVVRIDYPRKGIKTLAFVTGQTEINGLLYYSLFVPTTPNPTSGFFCMIPVSDAEEIDIDTETAMRIIASGGMIK
ncbi:MAG: DUF502 domain-containing protein [Elusimicrobiota bacterium]|nr:DUF502 domain-containing protein [Elusimicrobiota bacterium]